jgi:ABC-type multidrug transport system permease subunit
LVALLLALVFGSLAFVGNPIERGQRTINLLFLLTVSSYWFGGNNAAKEFVKERAIFTRERDFNLRIDSYYASKFVVLTAMGLIQVTLLFGVMRIFCGPPGNAFGQWAVLVLLAMSGTTAGLLASALARTEEVAVALVPVIVIPQIILAGVVAPLSGLSQWLAQGAITAYPGQQALEALIPAADAAVLGIAQRSFSTSIAIAGIHAAICVLLAILVLAGKRTRN